LLKLRRRDELSDEEAGVIAGLVPEPQLFDAGADIVKEGDRPTSSALLVEGFAGRYKVLEGGGRQITALHVAGDFVDLHSMLLKTMDHGVTCLTPCWVSKVPHTRLVEASERYPHLGRMFWLITLIDGAIHREWLTAMGRRTALAHMAHLICELYTLLAAVELASDFTFLAPISQSTLADVLGLSSVHVNRVLQELRATELISWQGATVKILDWDGLKKVAEFDPGYLHLHREPR
jgi:CRP-like cAMP-binding protein